MTTVILLSPFVILWLIVWAVRRRESQTGKDYNTERWLNEMRKRGIGTK